MTTLIETPRLIMRKFTLDDLNAVFEFSSDLEVTKLTGDICLETIEQAKEIITDIWLPEYKKYGYARYALVHKGDDKVIGFCGLKFVPGEVRGEKEGAPDIGYRMLKEYWGRGLGFEGASAAMEYGVNELGLSGIFGDAMLENTASNKILEKLGLRFDRTITQDGLVFNRYKQPMSE
jgi:ribosomal-protein-alanine N-acetyltransferase